MAIRIRNINGITVALCAAKTDAVRGDIYLDDAAHHALSTKFNIDWLAEGLLEKKLVDEDVKKLILHTENNRPLQPTEGPIGGG